MAVYNASAQVDGVTFYYNMLLKKAFSRGRRCYRLPHIEGLAGLSYVMNAENLDAARPGRQCRRNGTGRTVLCICLA